MSCPALWFCSLPHNGCLWSHTRLQLPCSPFKEHQRRGKCQGQPTLGHTVQRVYVCCVSVCAHEHANVSDGPPLVLVFTIEKKHDRENESSFHNPDGYKGPEKKTQNTNDESWSGLNSSCSPGFYQKQTDAEVSEYCCVIIAFLHRGLLNS